MRRIIVFSGAGLSADSGLSTYRDKDGIWSKYPVEDVSFYPSWRENFQLVHQFHDEFRSQLAKCTPNKLHNLIGKWQTEFGSERVIVITQNTDDLLERAGCESVLHLHGVAREMVCLRCENVWDIGYAKWFDEGPPCPECGSVVDVKPNVVFFHEPAPEYEILKIIGGSLCDDDLLFVVGTSGAVVSLEQYFPIKKGLWVLNNLSEMEKIDHKQFDHIFFMQAEKAAIKIDKIVSGWMQIKISSY